MALARTRRRTPSPPASPSEVVILETTTGQALAVEIREPKGVARGTAILLHSMMASRRMWNSPHERGVAAVLNEHGLRTLALDFRGHGDSGPSASQGARWSYDDLVREDVPVLCRAARERWPSARVTLVGHSLGGHVSLASLSTYGADADAVAVLATNVWMPSQEPNPLLSARKGAAVRFCELASRLRGYFPARALSLGSDDEAAPFMASWIGWWKRDRWTSDDLATDYRETLSKLRVPVLAIASLGDHYFCTPACAFRFVKTVPSERATFELVRRADDGGPAPDHMQLVTTSAAASAWHRVAAFCLGERG